MDSIMQELKTCYICGTTYGLHSHHIFYGTANRKKSEKYGTKIWLCGKHHNLSNEGIHFDKTLDLAVKMAAQRAWETRYGTRDNFIAEFGKSYL